MLVFLDHFFPPDLARYDARSLLLLDRAGQPVEMTTAPDGYRRLGATADDVDPQYLRLLIATEDKRFAHHPGVDPLALARAAWQFATRGRIVSGGSTITMQVARLLTPHRHDMLGKLVDIARALQLEAHFSKRRILAMYLTLAPMGGNVEGVRAGSLAWFGHDPRHLIAREASLLVALPRSPARWRPDHRRPFPRDAFHLAERLRSAGRSDVVHTTLDARLQRDLAVLAANEQAWQRDGGTIAALVVRNTDRAILAYLGGADLSVPGGMIDMVRAVRSPGSTLKPFIYGMAFDAGLLRPDTLVDDSRTRLGDYAPHDFDGAFHGIVSVREALQQSYNLPAVETLQRLGASRFVTSLRAAGATLVLPQGAAASLPVALGGVGIRLQDLAMLYAGLADGGRVAPLRLLASDLAGPRTGLLSVAAAAEIGDILAAMPLPLGTAPTSRRIAYKTGTSFGFRDAWAAGFSPAYTVVVWTGRCDGSPRPGRFGANTAAPLLFRIFDLLPSEPPSLAARTAGRASLAPSLVRLMVPAGPRIVFPPPGADIEASGTDGAVTPIGLEAAGGAPPYRWLADGASISSSIGSTSTTWSPPGIGFAHLTVLDRNGQAAAVDVRIR